MAFYWTIHTIVLFEVAFVCGFLVYFGVSLLGNRKWLRCAVYALCLVPVLVLNVHFLSSGPRVVHADWGSALYWSAQVGLIPLAMAPWAWERSKAKRRGPSGKRCTLMFLLVTCIILMAMNYGILLYTVRLQAQFQRFADPNGSSKAKTEGERVCRSTDLRPASVLWFLRGSEGSPMGA